jgi:hypothetical protein
MATNRTLDHKYGKKKRAHSVGVHWSDRYNGSIKT